jgi:hypothetical protein
MAHAPGRLGGQPAERRFSLLDVLELGLAQHRQRGQRLAGGHRRRVDPGEATRPARCLALREGHQPRQPGHQRAFAGLGFASLEIVVER